QQLVARDRHRAEPPRARPHAARERAVPGLPLRAAEGGGHARRHQARAPPTLISRFLGDELTEIMERLSKGQKAAGRGQTFLDIGVDTLPELPKDNTDRNRTSPFAFTGNKFEVRVVGSSQSI